MTSDPRAGAAAIAELEHGLYRNRLENAATILEMRLVTHVNNFEQVEPSRVEIWRDQEPAAPGFPDFNMTVSGAYYFLRGVAVGIQGDRTPDGD